MTSFFSAYDNLSSVHPLFERSTMQVLHTQQWFSFQYVNCDSVFPCSFVFHWLLDCCSNLCICNWVFLITLCSTVVSISAVRPGPGQLRMWKCSAHLFNWFSSLVRMLHSLSITMANVLVRVPHTPCVILWNFLPPFAAESWVSDALQSRYFFLFAHVNLFDASLHFPY